MKANIFKTLFLLLILAVSCTSTANRNNSDDQDNRGENTTRLMSYNIRNAKGLDDVTDYDRIADVINNTAPNIVGIQELDSVTARSQGVDVLDVLAEKTSMYSTYAAAIEYDGGKYGVGVLSKEKPINAIRVHLPCSSEPRMLLIVEMEDYYFGNTHFSLNEEDRLKAVDIIMEEVKKLNSEKLFFLVGDINATPESAEVQLLLEDFTSLVSHEEYTIPAKNPNRTIDYIFAYNANGVWESLDNSGVIAEEVASDHRPLYADVYVR